MKVLSLCRIGGAAHIEAGQGAIVGRTEVQPLDVWLAGPRGYRPGLAGS